MSSDREGLTIELTPESERIIQEWGKIKEGEFDDIIDSWLLRMQAWMLRETMRAFDTGKQPGGSTWPANPEWYAVWKRQFGSNKPGILSGALRRSFAQNKIVDKSKLEARIGSTLPYARAIHYGSHHTWAGIISGPGGSNPAWFMFHAIQPRPYFPTIAHGEKHGIQLFNDLVRKHIS